MWVSWTVFCVYLALPSTVCLGQVGRYELGNRLRRFERAWETADPTIRSRSTPRMERAVSAFFSLRLSEAARQLDEAWLTTQTKHPLDNATRWLISHRIACDTRLHDAATKAIVVKLQPFYGVDENPSVVQIRLLLKKDDDEHPRETVVSWDTVKDGYRWKHGELEAGDYRLSVSAITEARPVLEIGEIVLSYCDRLEDRVRLCREANDQNREIGTPTGTATVREICNQLESLIEGNVPEADMLAHRRLRFCEELIGVKCQSPKRLNSDHPGDYSVILSGSETSLPVRLNIPADVGRPLPVLIAFHGAGGSENMFFETYGAGRLVELAEERGWLVVSPRQGLFGLPMDVSQILQVLSEHFEIDRERVFLLGHSMGAGQVVSQCERHGELVAKAVAIGGGRTPRNRESVKHPKWLVSAGEHDFGRRGAARLAQGLGELGAKVKYSKVPDVEHMVIVQASLDEVFRFLEGD
jgi:predicted esterase